MRRAIVICATLCFLAGSCGDDSVVPDAATGAGAGANGGGGVSDGGSSTAGSGGSGGSGGTVFVVDTHTTLDGDEVLSLETNLPRSADACAAIPGAPCDDADGDGLTDAWEDLVLQRLRPFVRLDEAEQLVGEADFVLGVVGRVTPVGSYVHAYMMLGYEYDFGSCGGLTSHNGDSERVALQLEPHADDPGSVRVRQAYTAAHENTITDHSMLFAPSELGTLMHETDPSFGEPRWVVFASSDKHATYATAEICEGIAPGIPCTDEDCAPDNVADPSPFTRLFPYVNAGEPQAPMVADLSVIGFDGDDAWADQDFCGGRGGSGCSASVLEKLTTDPF